MAGWIGVIIQDTEWASIASVANEDLAVASRILFAVICSEALGSTEHRCRFVLLLAADVLNVPSHWHIPLVAVCCPRSDFNLSKLRRLDPGVEKGMLVEWDYFGSSVKNWVQNDLVSTWISGVSDTKLRSTPWLRVGLFGFVFCGFRSIIDGFHSICFAGENMSILAGTLSTEARLVEVGGRPATKGHRSRPQWLFNPP